MSAEWLRLEEERRYVGSSEAEVARAFRAELPEAMSEGYVPAALDWSNEAGETQLTVTYEYAPDRAARPV